MESIMNTLEWEKVQELTQKTIEKMKSYIATWKPDSKDPTCVNTLRDLKIVDISPNDQTLQYSFITQGLSQWESDKGKPYRYNCCSQAWIFFL